MQILIVHYLYFRENKNVSELALIHIYFGQDDTWLFKQRVAIKWYEIISKLPIPYILPCLQ